MTNDRAMGKPALASQIAGKILENPFAGAQLDWSLGCDDIKTVDASFVDVPAEWTARLPR